MLIAELEKRTGLHSIFDVRDQLKQHIYSRSKQAYEFGDAQRASIRTKSAIAKRRKKIRETFIEGIGGLPKTDAPLNAKITGVIEEDGFRIEKVIFQARPGVYVTGNFYLPNNLKKATPAVQFLCGHSELGRKYGQYQIVCRNLARAGLIVFAQDPVGQGERWSYWESSLGIPTVPPCVQDHDYAGSQCLMLGDSLAKYFVHDAMRGIDYMQSRPEVDSNKIGVTGSSGGGTQTCMMMMVDERVKAAAPGTFVMNRETYQNMGGAQDSEQIWPGFTAAGLDHEDILIAMAPKPVCVLAVTSDFFPIEGARKTVANTKRFWEMYGKGDSLQLVEDFSTHMYTRTLAKAAAAFFSRHLLGKAVDVTGQNVEPIEASKLNCTKSGQIRGEIKGAKFPFEENLAQLKLIEADRKKQAESRRLKLAKKWLTEKVFADRTPCDLNPRFYSQTNVYNLMVEMSVWWSQAGVMNHGMLFRDMKFHSKDLPVTLAVWDHGTKNLQSHFDWIKSTCAKGRVVMVLDVSGVGAIEPHNLNDYLPHEFYGVQHKFADDLIWLDDSLSAMRVFDVTRAIDMIANWPGLKKVDVQIFADGRGGIYGQFASAIDKRIKSIDVNNDVGSYASWVCDRNYNPHNIMSVVLPGMLKYFDLPDLKKMAKLR